MLPNSLRTPFKIELLTVTFRRYLLLSTQVGATALAASAIGIELVAKANPRLCTTVSI